MKQTKTKIKWRRATRGEARIRSEQSCPMVTFLFLSCSAVVCSSTGIHTDYLTQTLRLCFEEAMQIHAANVFLIRSCTSQSCTVAERDWKSSRSFIYYAQAPLWLSACFFYNGLKLWATLSYVLSYNFGWLTEATWSRSSNFMICLNIVLCK